MQKFITSVKPQGKLNLAVWGQSDQEALAEQQQQLLLCDIDKTVNSVVSCNVLYLSLWLDESKHSPFSASQLDPAPENAGRMLPPWPCSQFKGSTTAPYLYISPFSKPRIISILLPMAENQAIEMMTIHNIHNSPFDLYRRRKTHMSENINKSAVQAHARNALRTSDLRTVE